MWKKILSYRPSKILCFFYLGIPLVFCFLSNMTPDNDTWFLLRSGNYVLSSFVPHIEPFTMHQGFSYVMQQWLGASVFAFVYNLAGGIGLAIFVTCIDAFFLFLLYRLCMLISSKHFYLSITITFIVGSLLSLGFFVARPQIFSYVIYLLLFYSVESYIRKKKNKYLLLLPLLSILEINLHGATWWMLLCFLLPYLIDSFSFSLFCFQGEGYNKKPLFLSFLSMILVAFLNPYGIKMLQYLFTAYRCPYLHKMILEMMKPTLKNFFGVVVYVSIIFVLILYLLDKNKRIKVRYFCLLLGTIFLALTANRSYPYFLIGSFFPLADYFSDKKRKVPTTSSMKNSIFCWIFFPSFFLLLFFFISTTYQKVHPLDGVVSYLNQNTQKEDIKLYTGFDDGSYLEFQGYYPYIDPRAEIFLYENNHQKDILGEYYHLQHHELDVKTFLEQYSFTHLLVQEKDALWDYLEEREEYKVVYQDEKYKIYVP